MNAQLLEACARELEHQVASIVEQAFAVLRKLPDELHEIEIPWIGGSFDPHAPQAGLVNVVIKALAARAWCEQLEPNLPPLPLSFEAIKAMQAGPDRLWGWYAEQFRDSTWDIRKVPTFDAYVQAHRRAGTEL